MSKIELPSYLDQSPEVKQRFEQLRQRETILEVKNLNKQFDTAKGQVTALKDIDFKVHRREFVTVIGPSGCGKSTLIRILAGLESETSGQVLLDNHPVKGPGPDRGMVFQGYTLFPWLTVKKNVMFGLRNQGISPANAESEAMQFCRQLPGSAFRWHETARCHCPGTGSQTQNSVDGRAVWCTGCPDPIKNAVVSYGDMEKY